MKIFLLQPVEPRGKFAHFSHVGTWKESPCINCGNITSELVAPILVEWEYGTNQLGDFSWCGLSTLVSKRVFDFFCRENISAEFEMPIYLGKKKKRTVFVENDDPFLRWLRPCVSLSVNIRASNAKLKFNCTVCGKINYMTKGVVVNNPGNEDTRLFYLREFGRSIIYVNESFKNMMLDMKFSNLSFTYSGDVSIE